MKTYIMQRGMFLDKESGETTRSLSGKITDIHAENTESGNRVLVIVLGRSVDDDNAVTLRVKLYGDPGLKILRSLYGIANEIGGKTVTFKLEPREDKPSLLTLECDEETLPVLGFVDAYATEKKLLTDRILAVLVNNLRMAFAPLVVVHLAEAISLDEGNDEDEVNIARRVADHISAERQAGRSTFVCVKHTFRNGAMRDGYITAVREVAGLGKTFWFHDAEDIDTVWLANVEPIERPEVVAETTEAAPETETAEPGNEDEA